MPSQRHDPYGVWRPGPVSPEISLTNMLFEIRRMNLHSLKEIFREYLMIVVGILTALGLEQLAANRHHAHMAAEAREHIVAEIRANVDEVRDSVKENRSRRDSIDKVIASLQEDIKKGVAADIINRNYQEDVHKSVHGVNLPGLRHEGWDVAVANLSASYIDSAALRRYSIAYSAQRDITSYIYQCLTSLISLPRLTDAQTDLEMQRVDPIELLKVLKQMSSAEGDVIGNLETLRRALENGLEEEKK